MNNNRSANQSFLLQPFEAIIFDMDNTLLKSNIDFKRMRKVIYDRFVHFQILPAGLDWKNRTPSQIIELARIHPDFSAYEREIWQLVEEIEAEGMQGAVLESGARELLEHLLERKKRIALLTNNSYEASIRVLEQLSVKHFFHIIAGREQMEQLKPSPSGVWFILQHHPELAVQLWMMVGDSWIDGMAAQQAGIRFIAYQANQQMMSMKKVKPIQYIQHLVELEQWL